MQRKKNLSQRRQRQGFFLGGRCKETEWGNFAEDVWLPGGDRGIFLGRGISGGGGGRGEGKEGEEDMGGKREKDFNK